MAVLSIKLFSNALHRTTLLTAIVPLEVPYLEMLMNPEAKDKTKPFRSLYLLHGFFGCHTDWLNGTRIENLAAQHNIAVFCPSCENSFYLDDMVTNTLYEKYVTEELIDFTRKMFPISKERKDTTIGGLSMGGYGSLRNGLKHSDVFGNIIALSSGILMDRLAKGEEQKNNPIMPESYYNHVFGDATKIIGSDIDPKALASRVFAEKKDVPNIYMACGTEDVASPMNKDFSAYLDQIGMKHVFLEGPGIHDWNYWDKYIENALNWLDGIV